MEKETIFEDGILYHGDCLEEMKKIPTGSIDLICADLPYGKTKDPFDVVIPPEKLWPEYWRVLKPNGAVVLFGQDKFTAMMMLSSKWHRYNLVWDKVLISGHLNANKMPLRSHEDVMVFYKELPTYNSQKTKGKASHTKGRAVGKVNDDVFKNQNYGNFNITDSVSDMKHPKSILRFQKPHSSKAVHRTEKPVGLIEWVVNSYSNPGDTVLDNTCGSGTTGVACRNTGRKFVLIEKNEPDCETTIGRLS